MHIDHSKFIDLLSETSGIEKEKVEQQLQELIDEVQQALDEGEAYEIEGFGVFSGIGNNVLFIPSDELETEINYKYVGMEPIELESGAKEEASAEVPQEEPEDDTDEEEIDSPADEPEEETEDDLDDDPFGGLLDDEEESEDLTEAKEEEQEPSSPREIADEDEDEEIVSETGEELEEKPGPDDWGIDSYKDDGAENVFSGLVGESQNQDEPEDDAGKEERDSAAEDTEDSSWDEEELFGGDLEAELEEESEELQDELSSLMGEGDTTTSGPEEEELDLGSAFGEETEESSDSLEDDSLESFFGDDPSDEVEEKEETGVESLFDSDEDETVRQEEEQEEPEEEFKKPQSLAEKFMQADAEESASKEREEEAPEPEAETPEMEPEDEPAEVEMSGEADDDDDEDFDDPFAGLSEEEDEEREERPDDDVLPVVTNVSSGLANEKKKDGEMKDESDIKDKKKVKEPKEGKGSTILLVLIVIIALCGGAFALHYYGIVHIPGVDKYLPGQQVVQNQPRPQPPAPQQQTQPVQPPEQQETTPQPATIENTTDSQQPRNEPAAEQEGRVIVPDNSGEPDPEQPTYGLEGVPVEAANDGYTIVIFSLTNESNARAKQRELSRAGFRALLVPKPSSQYGTLWRVSIGQFESLTDAAIASERLDKPYATNFFIAKIK